MNKFKKGQVVMVKREKAPVKIIGAADEYGNVLVSKATDSWYHESELRELEPREVDGRRP